MNAKQINITDQPLDHGRSPEELALMQKLKNELDRDFSKYTIKNIQAAIAKYPHNEALYNYLYVAYMKEDKPFEAERTLLEMQMRFPSYLFGFTELVKFYLEDDRIKEGIALLGDKRRITDLITDRDTFHVNEIQTWDSMMVLYYVAIRENDLAEETLDSLYHIVKKYNKDYKSYIRTIHDSMMRFRMYISMKWLTGEMQDFPTVVYKQPKDFPQRETLPVLHHAILYKLYAYSPETIPQNILQDILALPRPTLVEDLAKVALDSVDRWEYWQNLDEEWDKEKYSFFEHALNLLMVLEAEEVLPQIMDIFRQDEAFFEYWVGDYIIIPERPLSVLGRKHLDVLLDYMKEPFLHETMRNMVVGAVVQMAFEGGEARDKSIAWLSELYQFFWDNKDKEGLIDGDLLGSMEADAADIAAIELLPWIKKFRALGLTNLAIMGDKEEDLMEAFSTSTMESHHQYIIPKTIFELYDASFKAHTPYTPTSTSAYKPSFPKQKDRDYMEVLSDKMQPIKKTSTATSNEVGRNDPCPCGSGKKYKKCHGA